MLLYNLTIFPIKLKKKNFLIKRFANQIKKSSWFYMSIINLIWLIMTGQTNNTY